MRAVITFESIYGNTRAVAEAVAEGMRPPGDVAVVSHHEADAAAVSGADLLVVGAPTHMHGLPTSLSRKMAAQASEEEGGPLDPGATAGPGIRSWLSEQPESFLVEDAEGPLADGELERAREWGSVIAAQVRATIQETAR